MLELKRLSVDDGLDIYTMLQEIPAEENGLINKANGLTFDEYKEWLIVKQRDSEQEGIVDGWKVPSTTFWLYADGIPVGFGSVRHFLTEALRKAGGNIGYGIAPAFRGKGYGKELLRLLLNEAKKMGIDKNEVIVLGDSFNDYSMFIEFENSYAMENAIPEIKEIAKYITDTNNNDGVAKAIYKCLDE